MVALFVSAVVVRMLPRSGPVPVPLFGLLLPRPRAISLLFLLGRVHSDLLVSDCGLVQLEGLLGIGLILT